MRINVNFHEKLQIRLFFSGYDFCVILYFHFLSNVNICLQLDKTEGFALSDKFAFEAEGCDDDLEDFPLYYFFYTTNTATTPPTRRRLSTGPQAESDISDIALSAGTTIRKLESTKTLVYFLSYLYIVPDIICSILYRDWGLFYHKNVDSHYLRNHT